MVNGALEQAGSAPLAAGCKLIDLISRPQVTIALMSECLPDLQARLDLIRERREETVEAVEILIKYDGYIRRERIIADKIGRLEAVKIRGKFNYAELNCLSTEARQKLIKIDPETIAQAGRIPGVSPSDINALLVLCGR